MREAYSYGSAKFLSKFPIHFKSYLGVAPWLELLYRKTKLRGWTWKRKWRHMFNVGRLRTPLEYAFQGHGDEMTIGFLLEHTSTITYGTVLDAMESDQVTTVQLLLDHFNMSEYSWDSSQTLYALRCGYHGSHMAFVFFMDIDDASCEPERRMHAAKQEDMMLSLLHYGANANLRGNVGFLEETFLGVTSWNAGRGIWPSDGEVSLSATPLVCAAALGIDWAVRVLVEHGADCNSRAFGKSFWPRSQGSMRDDYKHLEYQGHRTEPGWQAGRLAQPWYMRPKQAPCQQSSFH